jgi:hypothetical protein
MASSSFTRKRLCQNDNVALPRKRAHGTEVSPSLMGLPFEIRHQILKHILLRADPLEFNSELIAAVADVSARQSDFLLYSATRPSEWIETSVLQVCHRLYEEASEVLCSNTINIRIGRPHLNPNYSERNGWMVL